MIGVYDVTNRLILYSSPSVAVVKTFVAVAPVVVDISPSGAVVGACVAVVPESIVEIEVWSGLVSKISTTNS